MVKALEGDERRELAQDMFTQLVELTRHQARMARSRDAIEECSKHGLYAHLEVRPSEEHAVLEMVRSAVHEMLTKHLGEVLDESLVQDRAGNIATAIGHAFIAVLEADRRKR